MLQRKLLAVGWVPNLSSHLVPLLPDFVQGIPVNTLFGGVEVYRLNGKTFSVIEVLSLGVIEPGEIIIRIGVLRLLFNCHFVVVFCYSPFIFLKMGIPQVKIRDGSLLSRQLVLFNSVIKFTTFLIRYSEI